MQHFRPERDTIDDETNRNNETKLRPIRIRSPVKPNHGVYRRLAGAKLGATDDTDWYGLYIPPPISVLGLEREEHFVFTTGGKPGGNGPLDVDVCLYTLMKWARLAAKGNPSALHFLFALLEFTTQTWDEVCHSPNLRADPQAWL